MNCPATTQQSLGENELDSLNTFKSGNGSHTHTLSHTLTRAEGKWLTLSLKHSHTRTAPRRTHQTGRSIRTSGQVIDQLFAAPVPCHGLSIRNREMQRDVEEEREREGGMDGTMKGFMDGG